MTDATAGGPTPKPGILDIAPYVGGKSSIAGVAKPIKLSSNENALGAGEKAREAFAAAATRLLTDLLAYPRSTDPGGLAMLSVAGSFDPFG